MYLHHCMQLDMDSTRFVMLLCICWCHKVSPSTLHRDQSGCVQLFDQGFRQCFRDSGGFELDTVHSLVTNETSSRLPPNLVPQKQNLISSMCQQREVITNCITATPHNRVGLCQRMENSIIDSIVSSMVRGLGDMCGAQQRNRDH